MCSSICRTVKTKANKKTWYLANKDSENARSRLKSASMSKKDKAKISRRFREKNGLNVLPLISICVMCRADYSPSCHNSKFCSDACRDRNTKELNSKYDYYKNNIQYRLATNLRNRLSKALRRTRKPGSAEIGRAHV